MRCFVTNCVKDASKFDAAAKDDCLLQQVFLLKRNLDNIFEHYLGTYYIFVLLWNY